MARFSSVGTALRSAWCLPRSSCATVARPSSLVRDRTGRRGGSVERCVAAALVLDGAAAAAGAAVLLVVAELVGDPVERVAARQVTPGARLGEAVQRCGVLRVPGVDRDRRGVALGARARARARARAGAGARARAGAGA